MTTLLRQKLKMKKLADRRDKARQAYRRASANYLKALKVLRPELEEARDVALENMSYFKPSDFIDTVLCWPDTLADTVEELRYMKGKI